MRKRISFLLLVVMVAALLPLRAAQAQEPLSLLEYINKVVDYTRVASPLVDRYKAALDEVKANPKVANDLHWQIAMQKIINEYSAADALLYELVPPAYIVDTHLYLVASIGYNDASLNLARKFLKTKDPSIIPRIEALRANAVTAFNKYYDMISYFI